MNLPPGVRLSDLPGWSPDDIAWDAFLEMAEVEHPKATDEELEELFHHWLADCEPQQGD